MNAIKLSSRKRPTLNCNMSQVNNDAGRRLSIVQLYLIFRFAFLHIMNPEGLQSIMDE